MLYVAVAVLVLTLLSVYSVRAKTSELRAGGWRCLIYLLFPPVAWGRVAYLMLKTIGCKQGRGIISVVISLFLLAAFSGIMGMAVSTHPSGVRTLLLLGYWLAVPIALITSASTRKRRCDEHR